MALTRPNNVSKEIINQRCILCCVLCIVYCASQYCFVPTIKCKFFQQNLIFFHKTKRIILYKWLNVFSSVVGFSMSACSVRLMWPSLWWSCCVFGAVAPSFRWPDWAVVPPAVGAHEHVMQPIIKTLFNNRSLAKAAPSVWNLIPVDIRAAPSLESFNGK